jgi:hypothetical protein
VTSVFPLVLTATDADVVAAVVVLLLVSPHRSNASCRLSGSGAIVLSMALELVIVPALGRSGLRVNQHGSVSPVALGNKR